MNIKQLKDLLQNFQSSLTNQPIAWTLPTDLEHGILTTNIAFRLAKELRQNPIAIAQNISDELNLWIDKISGEYSNNKNEMTSTPVGAYINIVPNQYFYIQVLNSSIQSENLVKTSDQKFILDYIAANVAKKLSIGNMRNCNIGDSIRRILSLKYPNLITDNHWGDWGVNMGILIWGWKSYDHAEFSTHEPMIEKLTKIYVWANAQKEVVLAWDNLVRQEFLKLEQKDKTNYDLWQEFITTTKQDLRLDLDLMGVPKHDIEQGESYYESDMNLLTNFMEKHSIWISEGKARYFDFEVLASSWIGISGEFCKKISNLGRCYLISSTGYTSYCYRDVATKLQYARDLKIDLALVVTDKTQKHNFDQAFSIISYLASLPEFEDEFGQKVVENINWNNMKHLGYGFLKLESGKMSARKGNVILLRDLVKDVQAEAKKIILEKTPDSDLNNIDSKSKIIALAAIKWNDLKQSYEQDITFDINQVLNFVGNTGVYQLYTYARLNSVLNKLKLANPGFQISNSGINGVSLNLIYQKGLKFNLLEEAILKEIWTLAEILESICDNYQIHLLTNHLYQLSNLINKWYNDVPILKDDRQEFMINFINKIMNHLKYCLDLLGIKVIDKI